MSRKTWIKMMAAFVVSGTVGVALYFRAYPIKLESYIGNESDIQVYDRVDIGRKVYFLIEKGEALGSVTLKRGWNGRYQLIHLGYGGGNFLDGIVENDGRKYLLFGGRDIAAQISKIEVQIDGKTYGWYSEEPQAHFLLYTEVDKNVADTHVNRDKIFFYNEKGTDITEDYCLNGGGIQ